MALILASQSPRRRELLGLLGQPFTVCVADVDETMDPSAAPEDEVARISRKKALAVPAEPDDVVISADTIVVLKNEILGKPKDPGDAARMLSALAGRTHRVMTGLTVRRGARVESRTVTAQVTFRPMTRAEIDWYVATGEPMDKAGAYGIQGRGALFVTGLEGDYYAVMGLPVCTLAGLLADFGVNLMR